MSTARQASFYADAPRLPNGRTSVPLWGHPDCLLEYAPAAELLPSDKGACRPLHFVVRRARDRRLLAHGRVVVLSLDPAGDCRGTLKRAGEGTEEGWELLDLAQSGLDGFRVFRAGRVLALQFFEVHARLRGAGVGRGYAMAALKMLATWYRAVLVVLRPWPIQFLGTPYCKSKAFYAAKRRLSQRYRRDWGMTKLRGTQWLGMAMAGYRLQSGPRGWRLKA